MFDLSVLFSLFLLKIGVCTSFYLEQCKLLDLTYDFSAFDTPYWGGRDKFQHEIFFKGLKNPDNFFYKYGRYAAIEHGGTHADAPNHFASNGIPVNQISLENLVGPVCVINITDNASQNVDYLITWDDIEDWESANGRMQNCILAMNSGWNTRYFDKNLYFGTENITDPDSYHFPGISAHVMDILVTSKRIKAYGVDTPSTDFGQSKSFEVHQVLAKNKMPGLENLANLDKLPPIGATIIAMPMKIKDGSGSPLRAFAFGWDGPIDPCSRSSAKNSNF